MLYQFWLRIYWNLRKNINDHRSFIFCQWNNKPPKGRFVIRLGSPYFINWKKKQNVYKIDIIIDYSLTIIFIHKFSYDF